MEKNIHIFEIIKKKKNKKKAYNLGKAKNDEMVLQLDTSRSLSIHTIILESCYFHTKHWKYQ
jgi:hypothetical protein